MTPGYDPTAFADLADMLRKKQQLQQMPNVTQTQPQTQPPAQPIQADPTQAPNYLQGIAGARDYQPPTDMTQVAGSATYKPPEQPQPQQLYDPKVFQENQARMAELQKRMGNLDIAGLEKSGQELSATPPFPTGQGMHRNKFLGAVMAPFMAMQYLSDPRAAMRNYNLATKPGLAGQQEAWQQDFDRRKRDFEVRSNVMSKSAQILNEEMNGARTAIEAQAASGRFLREAQNWPLQDQILAARLAEQQALTNKAKAPQYSKQLDTIQLKNPDGSPGKVVQAYLVTHPDGKKAEFAVPGLPDFVPLSDVIGASKTVKPSNSFQTMQYENEVELYKKNHNGQDPDPEARAKIFDKIRLEAQTAIGEREKLTRAVKSVGDRINKGFLDPINKHMLEIQSIKTTIAEARADPNNPTKTYNAIAQAVAPLEAVRSIVGSGRVAVSEYPLIKDAPGKPQSFVAKIKNWLGKGSPVPLAALDDLDKFADAMLADLWAMRQMGSEGSYGVLGAKTEEEAVAAGKKFDEDLKAYQNPGTPRTETPKIETPKIDAPTEQRLDRINKILRGNTK